LEECEPREAGGGAEKDATPNAQGIHPLPLLGPSFEQGWAVEAADGQLTWVEGSVEEEAVYHINSTVQGQQQEETKDEKVGRFARSSAQLCPDIKLKTWEDFKLQAPLRHHGGASLKISFCDDCGDFFARGSLERRCRNPPTECFNVTPEKADAKRRETEKVHDKFRTRLEGFLRTGEDIGRPFSQIIKEKYPYSSKMCTGGSGGRSQLNGC
jgi:hypothetical protein